MKAKENKEKIVKLERIRKKRKSLNEDVNKYDDVFIKMPVEEPVNKKLKVDRPKTVKTYQAKFRSTAVRILQESGNFIDAFVAAPTQPLHRKKKAQSCKSPTTTPPKLQLYKDTLEMANETTEEKESETKTENAEDMEEKSASVDSSENKSETVINDKITEPMDAKELDKESREQNSSESSRKRSVNGQLCSILTHDKRREKKKSVRWAEESDLKQIYYFEMDETERVNVYREHLKSIEIKQERKAFEHAQRLIGDKMEESIPWMNLIRIDLPAPLVERGCNSKEKEIQMVHQQSTLQDIYFSRERLPVTPHELKQESVTPQEPKIIPLEEVDDFLEESNPSSIIDFSALDLPLPKPEIPSVLSNLIMSIANPDRHAQPPPKTEIPSVLSNLMMSITNPDSRAQPPPKPEIPFVLSDPMMSIANPDSHAQPPPKTEIPLVLSNLIMSIANPDSHAQPPPKTEIPSVLSNLMMPITNPDSRAQPPPKPEIPSVLSNLMMSITNPDSRAQPPPKPEIPFVLSDPMMSIANPDSHAQPPPKTEIPLVLSNLIMSIANPDSHAQPPPKTEIPSVLSNLMMPITNPDSRAQPPPKPEIPSVLSDPMMSIANPDSHPQPPPKPEIPSVLSNLMMSITNPDSRAQPPTEMPLEHVLPSVLYPNHHSKIPVSGGGHVSSSVGLLGSAPPGYEPIVENHYTNDSDNLGPDWDSKGMPPDQYSDPFYQVHRGVPARNIRIPPSPKRIRPRMLQPPPIRGPMPKMQRGRGLRLMGPPQRKQLHILCRNFRAGTCKYGKNCNFLHPGLNGPPL